MFNIEISCTQKFNVRRVYQNVKLILGPNGSHISSILDRNTQNYSGLFDNYRWSYFELRDYKMPLEPEINCIKSTWNGKQSPKTYNRYRNKLNIILKSAEKQHFTDLLNSHKDNIIKSWQIMKNIVNKNKTRKMQDKFKFSDRTILSDGTLISNFLLNFS